MDTGIDIGIRVSVSISVSISDSVVSVIGRYCYCYECRTSCCLQKPDKRCHGTLRYVTLTIVVRSLVVVVVGGGVAIVPTQLLFIDTSLFSFHHKQ